MNNDSTVLELIMRKALLENDIFFDEQVFTRTSDYSYYIFDFVVYGEYCKIIVECDGHDHYNMKRWKKDSRRDLWSIQNGFQDVLRFNGYRIRKQIQLCIRKIQNTLKTYDEFLLRNNAKKEVINAEIERIKQKKDSTNLYNEYLGGRVDIWDEESLKRKEDQAEHNKRREWKIKFPNLPYYSDFRPIVSSSPSSILEPRQFADIGDRIPATEKETWELLKNLPKTQKLLMWKLIKETNKDGITIYRGSRNELQSLLDKGLIVQNTLYKGRGEVSLFVLPYSQYLLRILLRKQEV